MIACLHARSSLSLVFSWQTFRYRPFIVSLSSRMEIKRLKSNHQAHRPASVVSIMYQLSANPLHPFGFLFPNLVFFYLRPFSITQSSDPSHTEL